MNIKQTSAAPLQNFVPAAKPDTETLNLAQAINDGLDKIEEIPDFKTRQEETLKLLVKANANSHNPEVKDLLRLSEVSVNAHETVYSAMKIGRITHQALINGTYGSAPLLAATAGKMFDTLQFGPRKTVSERLLKEMMRRTDDPAASEAYQIAKDVQGKVFSDTTGDNITGITKEVLSTVAGGFSGSADEVFQLGKNIAHRAFGNSYEASKLQTVIPHLIKAAPEKSTKAKLKFAWNMAENMKGDKAEEYLDSILKNAGSIPAGDAGRIGMAKDALNFYRDRGRLSKASADILKELTLKTTNPNQKKIFSLAKKINEAISPNLSSFGVDEDKIPDTSDLVRSAIDSADRNLPLDSDRAVLSYAYELVNSTQGNDGDSNNKICELLSNEIENPQCKKILAFTSEISGNTADSDVLLTGIQAAKDALDGKQVDLTEVGQKMAESFRSEYSKADAFRSLFKYMSQDSDYQNVQGMLKFGLAAAQETYSSTEDKISVSQTILQKIRDGVTDKDIDPIEFAREISHIPSSANAKFNVVEKVGKELINQVNEPEVKEFLNLAGEFVHDCADYDYSVKAFDTALNKAQELKAGKKFHLINDSLDVINSVPDKLIQANMLRKLDMKYYSELRKQNILTDTVEGPIEDLSALGETSTERLQTALNFLNILSSNSGKPQRTYNTLAEIYDRMPDKNKDIAAVAFFHFLRVDSGRNNSAGIRNSYIKPEEWKALGDTLKATQNEKSDFKLVKDALTAIDGFKESTPKAAISYVLIREMEERGKLNTEMRAIIRDYKHSCDMDRDRGRLSTAPAQDTLHKIAKLMIKNIAEKNPMLKVPAARMDTLWKNGDIENNGKLLMETLGDMDRFQKGEIDSVVNWAAEKVLGGSEEASQPAKKIISNDDYVIIGGVILPKRK